MKKCSFCAEEIQDEAVKCRFCNEFLDESKRPPAPVPQQDALPFYLKTSFIVITFLVFPVLALPSIWLHPKLHLAWKLILTVVTIILCWSTYAAFRQLSAMYDEASKTMNEFSY